MLSSGMVLAIDFNNGVWKTTFGYSQECNGSGYNDATQCSIIQNDEINWPVITDPQGGNVTEAVSVSNNSNGDGGLGLRMWISDGQNNNSEDPNIIFDSAHPELWIRWYMRYEEGFRWSGGNPRYHKLLYIYSQNGPGGFNWIPEPDSGDFQIWTNGGSIPVTSPSVSWKDVFGDTSDGLFHMFEVHIKNDTDGTDGIARMWIDGQLILDETNVNYTNGGGQGMRRIDISVNQNDPNNGRAMYVDFDDIEIWNTTPPSTDGFGNPWIGPLNDFLGAGAYKPKTPDPVDVR